MQTSYTDKILGNKPGLISGIGPRHIVTKFNQTVDMPIGCFVSTDTTNELCKLPAAAADITGKGCGFVLSVMDQEVTTNAAAVVPAGHAVSVMKKGRVWCLVEDVGNFVQDMQPSIRYAGTGTKGIVVCTPVASETALLPNAKILSVLNGNALVEINYV